MADQAYLEWRKQAERLHHLSMLYVGALVEMARGEKVGLVPQDYPGLKMGRDFLDIALLVRAEVNALSFLMVEKGVVTSDELLQYQAREYSILADMKAEQFSQQLGVNIEATPKCCVCGSTEGPFAAVLGSDDVVCRAHVKPIETIIEETANMARGPEPTTHERYIKAARKKLETSALQYASMKAIGSYINADGNRVCPCGMDREVYVKLFLNNLQADAEALFAEISAIPLSDE